MPPIITAIDDRGLTFIIKVGAVVADSVHAGDVRAAHSLVGAVAVIPGRARKPYSKGIYIYIQYNKEDDDDEEEEEEEERKKGRKCSRIGAGRPSYTATEHARVVGPNSIASAG